jgi:hypothetical protein
MSVKTVLEDFSKAEGKPVQGMKPNEDQAGIDIENRRERLTRCFEEIILPAVYEVENDLIQAGYWHRIQITQFSSTEAERKHIRDMMFYFYPEKTDKPVYTQKMLDTAYKAVISATPDSRKISFSILFPRRLPPVVEKDEHVYPPERIEQNLVDSFLEKFIKGAIEVYQSDRILI